MLERVKQDGQILSEFSNAVRFKNRGAANRLPSALVRKIRNIPLIGGDIPLDPVPDGPKPDRPFTPKPGGGLTIGG